MCKVCGKYIDMHLGDFNTERHEVMVICDECVERINSNDMNDVNFILPYVEWLIDDKTIRVYSLTNNAFDNRESNHPNESNVKLLKDNRCGLKWEE